MIAGFLTPELKSEFKKENRSKIHKSPLNKPTHQCVTQLVTKVNRTGLRYESIREKSNSCDIIRGTRAG